MSVKSIYILVFLTIVNKSECDLKCDLSSSTLDTIECIAIGGRNNEIQKEVQTRYNTLSTTTVDSFHKFDWTAIKGFVIKNALLNAIDPSVFVNATSLILLDLSGNPKLYVNFEEALPLMKNLQIVRLSGYGVGPEFQQLRHLRHLDISRNYVGSYLYQWDYINKLRNLEILDMSHNIEIDFNGYRVNKKLRLLDISYSTPLLKAQCFKNASKLRTLIMSHCGLTEIPQNTFDEATITNLDISFNNLTVDSLSSLNWNIIHVNVSHNHIKSFPRPYILAQTLTILDLSYNEIVHLHSNTFGGTEVLYFLDLSHNKLTALNYKIFFRAIKLEILNLSFNRITDLPESIFVSLKKLNSLNLAGNVLKTLEPRLFQENVAMRELRLGNNKLESLDIRTFANLNKTRIFDFKNNLLQNLPDDLLHLGNIEELRVSCNRLTYLPQHFFEASSDYSHWIVFLQGNPWKCACLTQMIETMENYQFNQEYFNNEIHPSCYLGQNVSKTCDDIESLSDEDFATWENIVKSSGIVC